MSIPNADNYYWRYGKAMNYIRARDIKPGTGFSRTEFNKHFVGNTDLRMLEAMLDDPEADQAHGWMRLGYLAWKDDWQGQIYRLQDQVKALGARPTPEQLAELNAKIAVLTQSADKAEAERDALKKQAEADEEAGRSFFRRIGDWLKDIGLIK